MPLHDLTAWQAIIWAICDWLFHTYCAGSWGDGALLAWQNVHNLTAFAGEYWKNASGDRAADWAIVVDNLIDLIDVANVRGDH